MPRANTLINSIADFAKGGEIKLNEICHPRKRRISCSMTPPLLPHEQAASLIYQEELTPLPGLLSSEIKRANLEWAC